MVMTMVMMKTPRRVYPGVKNADEVELRAIASPPEEEHVYNVADFNVMADIVDGLTRNICDRVEALDRALKGEQGALWEVLLSAEAPPTLLLHSGGLADAFIQSDLQ